MPRFQRAIFAILFVQLLLHLPAELIGQEKSKPNIIFILTDDLGWGDLGVLHQNQSKHPRTHQTPALDQMAADGIQLRAHYCPAPVCAPSRASLLMGVHQGHATVRNNQFDKALNNNHTLATVLKTAGYKTAAIGKYGLQGKGKNPKSWPGYPTKRGFDEFFGYVAHVDGHVHYPADVWPIGNSKSHKEPKPVWWNDKEVSRGLQKCYTTDLFTARSKAWITDHSKSNPNQPFFLFLAYDTPHGALQIPTGPYPKGRGLKGGIQWTGKPGKMINTANGTIDSFRHPDYTGKGWTDVQERFATMVRRIDNCVGDLLQTLKDLEIDDNTMVVFTSDNGPHHESYIEGKNFEANDFQSYGPFDGTKRDTWEGGIRMPTFVRWPGTINSGSRSDQPSQFHDWMATMCDAAGTAAPARCDGVSLMPTLTGQGNQSDSTVYIEYQNGGKTKPYQHFMKQRQGRLRREMQVIFADGFKGIRTNIKSHQDNFEIYDLTSDFGERKNLAGTGDKFARLQRTMKDKVLQLRIPNDSAKRPYDQVAIPGNSLPGKKVKPGLSSDIAWRAFETNSSYVPNTAGLKAVTSGNSTEFDVKAKPNLAIEYQFSYGAATEGEKTITFSCETQGFVRMHEAGILDADFGYKPNTKVTRKLRLGAGNHDFKIVVLTNADGKAPLKFSVE